MSIKNKTLIIGVFLLALFLSPSCQKKEAYNPPYEFMFHSEALKGRGVLNILEDTLKRKYEFVYQKLEVWGVDSCLVEMVFDGRNLSVKNYYFFGDFKRNYSVIYVNDERYGQLDGIVEKEVLEEEADRIRYRDYINMGHGINCKALATLEKRMVSEESRQSHKKQDVLVISTLSDFTWDYGNYKVPMKADSEYRYLEGFGALEKKSMLTVGRDTLRESFESREVVVGLSEKDLQPCIDSVLRVQE